MTKRRYSIFNRIRGERRWERQSALALTKESAVKHWQNVLINGACDPNREWQLRPVKY